jgi:Stress responsive A/B Barrel Domain
MFRHAVLFTWKEGTTPQQVEKVAAELRTLPGIIAELRSYRLGPDAGVNPGNYQFAVVADFDSLADYLVYRDHPAHRAIIGDYIQPLIASRAAVQYEI